MELAALERLKNIPKTYNGENDVITFFPLVFIVRFILEDMHKSLDEFEFGQIPPQTTE